MKKENKTKTIEAAKLLTVLLVTFALLVWQITDKLMEFSVIKFKIPWYIVVIGAVLCSFVVETIILTRKSFLQKMKTSVWLATHSKAIVLFYALPLIALASAKADIQETIAELKDIISISWSVFSIIITVFFVWQVIIPKYLRKNVPAQGIYVRSKNKEMMRDKALYFEKVSIYFVSVDLVRITLVFLLIATAATYIGTKGVTLFNLNATRCSFYYCLTTIILLLQDVLKPTNEERDDLLSNAKISSTEIEKQAEFEESRVKARELIGVIHSSGNLSKSEKKKLIKEICEQYMLELREIN